MSSHAEKLLTLFSSQKRSWVIFRIKIHSHNSSLSLSNDMTGFDICTLHPSFIQYVSYIWTLVFDYTEHTFFFLTRRAFSAVKVLIRNVTLCVTMFIVLIIVGYLVGYNSTLMISLSLLQHDIMNGMSLSSVTS